MTIGVNLKTIVKNYSLCEKLFREDCKKYWIFFLMLK